MVTVGELVSSFDLYTKSLLTASGFLVYILVRVHRFPEHAILLTFPISAANLIGIICQDPECSAIEAENGGQDVDTGNIDCELQVQVYDGL